MEGFCIEQLQGIADGEEVIDGNAGFKEFGGFFAFLDPWIIEKAELRILLFLKEFDVFLFVGNVIPL